MSRDTATGSVMTCIVAYEALACLTGRPKVTELSRRHPAVAYALAAVWLTHVFWRVRQQVEQVMEELEGCEEWH